MDFNWKIIGNNRAVEFLDKSLASKNIANFYIFSGLSGTGKFTLAKNFISNIFFQDQPDLRPKENFLETNSDFFVVEREEDKKDISIDQIRGLIERFKTSSFLNSYRTAIIKNAENLNENSANALLKVLEETNDKTVIIITVDDVDKLPKTIISRSQIVNLFPVKFDLIYKHLIDEFKVGPSLAKELARISSGCPAVAIKFIENEELYNNYKAIVYDFIDFLKSNFLDRTKIIDNVIKKNDFFSNSEILTIWQSVLRDLIFIHLGHYDYIKNIFAIENLESFRNDNLDLKKIREDSIVLNQGLRRLALNISIRNTLEYIAVNI